MTESVVRIQELVLMREAADRLYAQFVERARAGDANYSALPGRADDGLRPVAGARHTTAPLLAINFADDELNPPELGVMEAAMARIPGARTRRCLRDRNRMGTTRRSSLHFGSRICRSAAL